MKDEEGGGMLRVVVVVDLDGDDIAFRNQNKQ